MYTFFGSDAVVFALLEYKLTLAMVLGHTSKDFHRELGKSHLMMLPPLCLTDSKGMFGAQFSVSTALRFVQGKICFIRAD